MKFEVAEPEDIFIRPTTIKKFFNENKMWFSDKTTKVINKAVKEMLLKAIERAKLSGRKRIFPQDI